jgi:hypothetical protein
VRDWCQISRSTVKSPPIPYLGSTNFRRNAHGRGDLPFGLAGRDPTPRLVEVYELVQCSTWNIRVSSPFFSLDDRSSESISTVAYHGRTNLPCVPLGTFGKPARMIPRGTSGLVIFERMKGFRGRGSSYVIALVLGRSQFSGWIFQRPIASSVNQGAPLKMGHTKCSMWNVGSFA